MENIGTFFNIIVTLIVVFMISYRTDEQVAGSIIPVEVHRLHGEINHYNPTWRKWMVKTMMKKLGKLGGDGWVNRVKRFSRLIGVVSKLESCDSFLCKNGATCLTNVLYKGGFECVCKVGYYGPLCDQTSEDCMFNPCLNEGICVAVYDGYVCGCTAKFSGTHCEIELEKPSNAWYTELGLDKYVSFYSFSAFVIVMVCLVVMATFCCFVENKKVELRLRNAQYQRLAKSLGMRHLQDQEFIGSSYFNALNEVFIDGGYRAAAMVGWVINLPTLVEKYFRKKELKKTKKLEKKIDKYYKKRNKRSEWWDLYMKVRDRMRQEEVQAIVGRELKIAMETEMKRIKRNEEDEENAFQQLQDVSGVIDDKTNEALVAMDAKVPMTTIKDMALNQGKLSKNFVDFLPVDEPIKEEAVPLLQSSSSLLLSLSSLS